ncbi:MAG: hypothetical protein LUG18_05905 [Candidatus Azobacteroides sp.]|nr:hypothetical protein [Candidatus Azobacteroides sp.]
MKSSLQKDSIFRPIERIEQVLSETVILITSSTHPVLCILSSMRMCC